MLNKNDFEFGGFPDMDEEIDIPESKPKTSSSNGLSFGLPNLLEGVDPNQLLHHLEDMMNNNPLMNQMMNSMLKDPSAMKNLEALGTQIANMLGLDPDSIGVTAIPIDPSSLNKTVSESLAKSNLINTHSIKTLLNNESINYPIHSATNDTLSEFYQNFGVKDKYNFEKDLYPFDFVCANDEVDFLDRATNIQFLEDHGRYLLFRAIPDETNIESFIVAICKQPDVHEGDYLVYIPQFGNTINVNEEEGTACPLDRFINSEAFDDNGNVLRPVDIDKIIAECDLMFCEISNRLTMVSEFGNKILQIKGIPDGASSTELLVGQIFSNESFKATRLLKDFGMDTEQKRFNFYIQFDSLVDRYSIQEIAEIIDKIDLNENSKVQSAELYKIKDGLGIKLDLGKFEKFIMKWKNEE